MDRTTIFTKTAKGLREASGKTSLVSRGVRNLLKDIDGKNTVRHLMKKHEYSEADLKDILEELLQEDFIREVEVEREAPVAAPRPAPPSPPPQQAGGGEDLDFTAISAAPSAADVAAERARAEEAERQALAVRAQQEARARQEAEEAARREAEARARAEVEARARAAAEAQARKEAEEQARREAEAKARAEAEARAKAEAEARARQEAEERARREAEERARQEAVARAVQEAEEKVRREAETKAKADADADADARSLAEAQQRKLAERRAQREAEERARQEGDAKVRAEEQARKQAEDKARQEAEEKARKEAEEQDRREAEEKARREAEEKARREAEEKARKEAEEKARREAEEKARKEAEEKARREAEEKARKEAEEKARREAEEKARKEAEEKARREAEEKARKEAEEKARREAEEKARKEAEEKARREAEEKARREAEEKARREAEETARREAEEKARREAEERARKEAEEKARREAEEKARKEAEEQARGEAEDQARREAEEEARRLAEEEEVRREAEAQAQREEAEALAASSAQAAAKPAPAHVRAAGGKPFAWGRLVVAAAVAVPVLGIALVHVVSFDGKIPELQQAASAALQQPVKITSVNASLFPPHLSLGGVVVGEAGQIKAPRVRLAAGIGAVFGGAPGFESLDVESPVLTDEGLSWLVTRKPSGQGVKAGQVRMSNVKLSSGSVNLPAFSIKAETSGEGLWKKAQIETADKSLTVELTSKGETVQFEASAASFAVPFGSSVVLADFSASGVAGAGGITVTEFKNRLHGGLLTGNAKVRWSGRQWSIDGELNARQIDTAQFLPGLLEGDKLEGKATFAQRSDDPAKLLAAPRLEGTFIIKKGTLLGVDLGRMIQSGDSVGKTEFTELSGSFTNERGTTQLQGVRLSAGSLSASGSAEADANSNIRGRLAVELRMPAETRRASVVVSGTTKAASWSRR
jgi:hypothetical protein